MTSHFIQLSSRVINKLHIVEIVKKPSKYFIHMNSSGISGLHFLGSGSIDSNPNIIEICGVKNRPDYDNIRDWLKYE